MKTSKGSCVIGALPIVVPERQADATLTQANPVSTTEYTVLDTTKNCVLHGISFETTGGTVSEVKAKVYIDGQTIEYVKANPVSGTPYTAKNTEILAEDAQETDTTSYSRYNYALLMGRSIKVVVVVTWTVQPTPLEARVQYSKW